VKIAVQLQPVTGAPPRVEYRWDPDTEILSARLAPSATGEGMSGSVGLEGNDGSWVILDVASGCIAGVEVAVWPEVRRLTTLALPSLIEDAHVIVPSHRSPAAITTLEMNARLVAEADPDRRTFHFRFGKPRTTNTVRVARDLLLDVDEKSQISGLWLLNVPPCPPEP
jgi:hypothetical protein